MRGTQKGALGRLFDHVERVPGTGIVCSGAEWKLVCQMGGRG